MRKKTRTETLSTQLETETKEETQMTELKKPDKKELSRDEKKALRRANMQDAGRLNLPEELKEKGYRYRVCNVTPGNIENYKSKGYEVVTHPITSGSGSLEHPEVNGIPTEFEVGGAKGSLKAIWMRITEEDAQINDELRDEDAKEQEAMIRRKDFTGIPSNQLIGSITKENLK